MNAKAIVGILNTMDSDLVEILLNVSSPTQLVDRLLQYLDQRNETELPLEVFSLYWQLNAPLPTNVAPLITVVKPAKEVLKYEPWNFHQTINIRVVPTINEIRPYKILTSSDLRTTNSTTAVYDKQALLLALAKTKLLTTLTT